MRAEVFKNNTLTPIPPATLDLAHFIPIHIGNQQCWVNGTRIQDGLIIVSDSPGSDDPDGDGVMRQVVALLQDEHHTSKVLRWCEGHTLQTLSSMRLFAAAELLCNISHNTYKTER